MADPIDAQQHPYTLLELVRGPFKADLTPAAVALMAAVVLDDTETLGQFFNIAHRSGWWWRRLPATGPLAGYLSRVAR